LKASIRWKTLTEVPVAWRRLTRADAEIVEQQGVLLKLNPTDKTNLNYSNAQLDDYPKISRAEFPNRPPLRLRLRARFHFQGEQPKGTAGFGFWNDPFLMTEPRPATLPKALWFFYSSKESKLALAQGIANHGWKMAAMDAWRPAFLALIPTLPLSLPLMWLPWFQKKLWPIAQRAMRCHEKEISHDLKSWHDYELVWGEQQSEFWIDQELQFSVPSPKGPLGLVIWMDNQYMQIDPRAVMKHGNLVLEHEQCLEIAACELSLHAR